MKASLRLLREHLHFTVVILILLVVMTWPTIKYVFDTDVFWLPTVNRDVWMEIWNAWHGSRIFAGASAFNMTEMLFHPVGMSLDLYLYNVFHMALMLVLQSVLPVSNAYSLIYLLFIISSAMSAYIYLLHLFKDKWLALFGAVAFGFSQHVIDHPMHMGLTQIFTLPLALYAFHRGILENNRRWIAVCGLLLGITIYVGAYMFMIHALIFGMVILYFALSRWRHGHFWIHIALLSVIALAISFPRIYPMVQDAEVIDDALNKTAGRETGNDLVASFVNYRNPFITPLFFAAFDIESEGVRLVNGWKHTSYLGYLPIVLLLVGFSRAKYRRKMLPWLLIMLPFFILRLGSELRINDVVYSNILLPKYYLDAVLPVVFEAVHETDHFQMGILLPLAILSCYGLKTILEMVPAKLRTSLILLCIALLAFEYYTSLEDTVLNRRNIKFIHWFLEQDDQESIRLINLPMGRNHAKIYSFYQTLNGYPHAEGVAHRTPQSSYSFIRQNGLLSTWFANQSTQCAPANAAAYQSGIEELLAVGFTHVVLHVRERGAEDIRDSFNYLAPAYKDTFAEIYHLRDMLDHCANLKMWLQKAPVHLRIFIQSQANMRQPDATVVSLYTGASPSDQAMRYHAIMLDNWNELIHIIGDEQDNAIIFSSNPKVAVSDSPLTDDRIFWIIYNPQQINLPSSVAYKEVFAGNLTSCERMHESENLAIDIQIDLDFPCELITDNDPLVAAYDNGIQLANTLHEIDNDILKFNLWWRHSKIRGFAYSVQIFNAIGEKVQQIDDVFRFEPLAHHEMDISDLAPGEYNARLIVYDYETKQSQPGVVVSTGQSFQRELEIARFPVDA